MGPLIGFALAAWAAPLGLFGARMIFAWLFVVAAVAWWVRQGLPESTIWRDEKTRAKDAQAATGVSSQGIRHLFSKKANITALLFGFGVYGFWGIVAGQAGIFMPRVYATAGVTSVLEQDLLQILL